jgi:hypothetical protein
VSTDRDEVKRKGLSPGPLLHQEAEPAESEKA